MSGQNHVPSLRAGLTLVQPFSQWILISFSKALNSASPVTSSAFLSFASAAAKASARLSLKRALKSAARSASPRSGWIQQAEVIFIKPKK